jgi:hypothetical protein
MNKPRLAVGMEVVVQRPRQADYATTIETAGRKWATARGVRGVRFDLVTWFSDSGYSYPILTTPERHAAAKRSNEARTRLFRCGIRVEDGKDHPDIDALEKMAEIAEAGMPRPRMPRVNP